MANQFEKERIKLCGQAVLDFINSKSTDNACISLIPKIQHEFGFSDDFKYNAEKFYPSLGHVFSNFKEKQIKLINLQLEYLFNLNLIEQALYPLMLEVDEYDFKKNILIINKEIDRDTVIRIPLECKQGFFKHFQNKIEKYSPSESHTTRWRSYHNELPESLFALKKIDQLFADVSEDFSKKQEDEFEKARNNKIVQAHSGIYYLQRIIKIILDRFLKGITVFDYQPFSELIQRYNRRFRESIELQPYCNLKYEESKINENWFYEYYKPPSMRDENRDYDSLGERYVSTYADVAIYFFVEFLKPHGNHSLFRLCDFCGRYFISSTKRKTRFCPEDKCRQTWHNRKRIETGEAKEYKRKKRKEGAKESYYG